MNALRRLGVHREARDDDIGTITMTRWTKTLTNNSFTTDSLWRDVLDINSPCFRHRGGGVDDAEVGTDTLAPHVVMVGCHLGHQDRAEDEEEAGSHYCDSDVTQA